MPLADGHTLLLGTAETHAINPHIYRKLSYDPLKQFATVGIVSSFPFALVVSPKLPVEQPCGVRGARQAEQGQVELCDLGDWKHVADRVRAVEAGCRHRPGPRSLQGSGARHHGSGSRGGGSVHGAPFRCKAPSGRRPGQADRDHDSRAGRQRARCSDCDRARGSRRHQRLARAGGPARHPGGCYRPTERCIERRDRRRPSCRKRWQSRGCVPRRRPLPRRRRWSKRNGSVGERLRKRRRSAPTRRSALGWLPAWRRWPVPFESIASAKLVA